MKFRNLGWKNCLLFREQKPSNSRLDVRFSKDTETLAGNTYRGHTGRTGRQKQQGQTNKTKNKHTTKWNAQRQNSWTQTQRTQGGFNINSLLDAEAPWINLERNRQLNRQRGVSQTFSGQPLWQWNRAWRRDRAAQNKSRELMQTYRNAIFHRQCLSHLCSRCHSSCSSHTCFHLCLL